MQIAKCASDGKSGRLSGTQGCQSFLCWRRDEGSATAGRGRASDPRLTEMGSLARTPVELDIPVRARSPATTLTESTTDHSHGAPRATKPNQTKGQYVRRLGTGPQPCRKRSFVPVHESLFRKGQLGGDKGSHASQVAMITDDQPWHRTTLKEGLDDHSPGGRSCGVRVISRLFRRSAKAKGVEPCAVCSVDGDGPKYGRLSQMPRNSATAWTFARRPRRHPSTARST
jgi:hypothetical protein